MTETSTETQLEKKCENCDAEIRAGSQFCYGCGKPVAAVSETNVVEFPVRSPQNEEDDAPEEFLAAAADAAEAEAEDEAEAESREAPEAFLVPEEAPLETEALPEEKPGERLSGSVSPERSRTRDRRRRSGKLETAASIQKRERLRVKKPEEVVWAAADPTLIFAIVAVGLLVISALIFYFAILGN